MGQPPQYIRVAMLTPFLFVFATAHVLAPLVVRYLINSTHAYARAVYISAPLLQLQIFT